MSEESKVIDNLEEDKEFVEVEDGHKVDSTNDDPTKRRVEITVRWTKEDTRVFDVPVGMSLDKVACDLKFDTAKWTPAFIEWGAVLIEDLDTGEEWVIE